MLEERLIYLYILPTKKIDLINLLSYAEAVKDYAGRSILKMSDILLIKILCSDFCDVGTVFQLQKITICCDYFSRSKSMLDILLRFGFVFFYLRGFPLPPARNTHTHTHLYDLQVPWKLEVPKLILPDSTPVSRFSLSPQERKCPLLWVSTGPRRTLYYCPSPSLVFMCFSLPQGQELHLIGVSSCTQHRPGPEQTLKNVSIEGWGRPSESMGIVLGAQSICTLHTSSFRRDPLWISRNFHIVFLFSPCSLEKIGYSFTLGFKYLTDVWL